MHKMTTSFTHTYTRKNLPDKQLDSLRSQFTTFLPPIDKTRNCTNMAGSVLGFEVIFLSLFACYRSLIASTFINFI